MQKSDFKGSSGNYMNGHMMDSKVICTRRMRGIHVINYSFDYKSVDAKSTLVVASSGHGGCR